MLYNKHANVHHYRVKYSWITFKGEFSFLADLTETHEHISTWNSDLVEASPTIILTDVAELWTKIAGLYTWHMFVSIQVSQLDKEWLDSVVIFVNNEAGKNDGMTGESTEISWPVF